VSSKQRPLKVAFLGPEGTFSEEALLAAVDRADLEPAPLPTIYDCVLAVQEQAVDRAFVPIENSLEGSVSATLDALVFETDDVTITGELVHPVQHSLIARQAVELEEIERVVSHPQANAQCARFLRERLPRAEVAAAPSTADAVKLVAGADAPWAALGTSLSAELYGCEVLLEGVEDHPENETRFVWLARKGTSKGGPWGDPSSGPFKTSVVFWGLPDKPGALVEILQEFAERAVNLSKIESRPLKQGLGRYIFFADVEGSSTEKPVEAAMAAVEAHVDTLRVLGSYPMAGPPPAKPAGATG
jgi:prephenate dehydratase